jgi:hypothetical protein
VTQTPPMLSEVIGAYLAYPQWLRFADVDMLVRLSNSREAARSFAVLELSERNALTFIDDCVEAHRIDTGKHKAQVERLRGAPDYKKMQAKLESLAKDYGAMTEDVREAFGAIRVALSYRARGLEYAVRSTSRKGDDASARSRAIGWLKESCDGCPGRTTSNTWRPCATPFSTQATRSVWTR